ncbi:hypothetical protein [Actinotignum schaalii]|uniref:hypothetical protein n=1 Tax=Actinotignum schaalii TaxID=59505 RepID=UPI00047B9C4C|nr:hypothetical protein [Actinotignum schaalii]AIE82402.1 hypothetical protein FB03_02950 [Actinotignum schaalii]WQN44448.1 hypothetical protein U4A90_05455 [Actinotignum schaalii]
MQRPDVLSEKVQQFAGDLIGVARLFDDDFTFVTDEATAYRQSTQRIQGTVGIQLDHMRLYLELDYSLFLSRLEQFLTVGQSSFTLRLHSKRSEPMIRWDYIRQPRSTDVPSSHVQIHAHRDIWTHAMVDGGLSARARKRANLKGRTPPISDLHIPLGSKRFRPCMEDVLLFILHEFGAHCKPGTEKILLERRSDWESIQARAVVREHPEEAISVLKELGLI